MDCGGGEPALAMPHLDWGDGLQDADMRAARLAGRIARALGFKRLPDHAKAYLRRYRAPNGPLQHLGPSYFEPVERLRASELDQPSGSAFFEAWKQVPGGHKWLHYFEEYDELFAGLRDRPIRMLEIGVYRGASLRTWRGYLHRDSLVVGIDIDPECARFDAAEDNVHVRIGSQADAAFLARGVEEFGPFDVILDDGSHYPSHMITSFRQLFLTALDERGLYIAEDTHANFWPAYRDQSYSFVDLCKDLVDVMHCHYAALTSESEFRLGYAEQAASLRVPRISAQIREISFRDSIVAIRKQPAGRLPGTLHR
jgi:hypothetical protein